MKKIFIKDKDKVAGEFQFFMHDFIAICKREGFQSKPDICPSYKYHIRSLLRRLNFGTYRLLDYFPGIFKRKSALLIAADGSSLVDKSFPYYGRYEIVPVIWDAWPYSWNRMFRAFSDLDINYAFVTSKQIAEIINKNSSVKAFWIPEGIDISHYMKGKPLCERSFDVFEMGRQQPRYHKILMGLKVNHIIDDIITSNIRQDGTLDNKKVKYSNERVYRLMADTKLMICFPQTETNPKRAGGIETLTQRYWEAMLSRNLMIGKAPKELIEVIGYDPVINVDWTKPADQIVNVLHHVSKYQGFVDKNRKVALEYAPWEKRIPTIINKLHECGFEL